MQDFSFATPMCLKFIFAKNIRHKFIILCNEIYIKIINSKYNGYHFAIIIIIATSALILYLVIFLLLYFLVLHPTLNRKPQISIGITGPHSRAPNFNEHCRTPTTTANLSRHKQIPRAPDLNGH